MPTDHARFIAHLKKGNKPKKGAACPDDIYDIIKTCLDLNKWDRKPFAELYAIFASLRDAEPEHVEKVEVDKVEGVDEVFAKSPSRKLSRTGTWLKPKPKV